MFSPRVRQRVAADLSRSGLRTGLVLRYLCNSRAMTSKRDHPEATSLPEAFSGAKRGSFFQQPPLLHNQFTTDALLLCYLQRVLPPKVLQEISPDLERFGERVATDVYTMGRDCELNPPSLDHFDAWGRRIDRINTCSGWSQLHDVAAEEGLVAVAYDRKYQQWSRVYQAVKLYLFSPSSGLYSCPLAMTDGAAKTLEEIRPNGVMLKTAYKHLTTRNPGHFWTSGQWMTERQGGSDVGNGTQTTAAPQSDGTFKLYGYKWFSSATDADMTLTLARIQQPDGSVIPGSRGITMFYLETRKEDGTLNNIEVQRLKNKLGTKQLPTAELLLDGSVAHQITEEGRGIAGIASMLTITRIHNSISAVAGMRRIVCLAQDYALRRRVFGKTLAQHPLHVQTIAKLQVELRAAFLLVMEVVRLLGLEECSMATECDKHLLRLLTPIAKLYTAKQAIYVASEGLESFGGQGYIEDTGLPGLLRDAQVLPIWEGTTNVLSLDVLRSIAKSDGQVLHAFQESVHSKLKAADSLPSLRSSCDVIRSAVDDVMSPKHSDVKLQPLAARDLAFSLARIYMAVLMIEHASWEKAEAHDIEASKRWCQQDLTPLLTNLRHNAYDVTSVSHDLALVMGGHPECSSKL
ncbi:acyl-CoA dehydrogenase family member 11 [Nematostella vectensis]|uniref:acyl-CoA dehydrogenase family member 11 n=1 Tax=Nematostella vectensis TaxID=45351 RepID=UPI002076F5EC|nr:acyl-CoA dehydrogenase family member 11 [Nematostella vectensis]